MMSIVTTREDISIFFSKKIDPVFGPLISHMIRSQPRNPVEFIEHYLTQTSLDKLKALPISENQTNNQQVYVSYVFPIISSIFKILVQEQPTNVTEFLLQNIPLFRDIQLQTINAEPKPYVVDSNSEFDLSPSLRTSASASQVNAMSAERRTDADVSTPRPSTGRTRARLDDALELEKKIRRQACGIEISRDTIVPSSSSGSNYIKQSSITPRPTVTSSIGSSNPLTIRLAVLGLAGAGKTTLINSLQGLSERPKPTVGFRPVTLITADGFTKVQLFDLGGGDAIRGIWAQYYHDVHGFVYVLDAAESEDEVLRAASVLRSVCDHPFLSRKPFLLVANSGRDTALSSANNFNAIEGIVKVVLGSHHIQYLCEQKNENENGNQGLLLRCDGSLEDPVLEAGLEHLLHSVRTREKELYARVESDSRARRRLDSLRRLDREKRVLQSKIAQVFRSQLTPEILHEFACTAEEDIGILDEAEALQFLASEIGASREEAELPHEAILVVKMVGRARLALQIAGAMRVPVSKTREALSWSQIMDIVVEIRQHLGLS